MKYVYLILREEKYCPENNIGDNIAGISSTKAKAIAIVKQLDCQDDYYRHSIRTIGLDDFKCYLQERE